MEREAERVVVLGEYKQQISDRGSHFSLIFYVCVVQTRQ